MNHPLLGLRVRIDRDVVLARQRARDAAALLGFDRNGQTRVATAVSEIVRNAFRYAGGGTVEFAVDVAERGVLRVRVHDSGPGISALDEILEGRYRSTTGMGMGIVGARRLVDEFDITSDIGRGTEVLLGIQLPKHAPHLTDRDCERIAGELRKLAPEDPLRELERQNGDLLVALEEIQRRQADLDRLGSELDDTNRGVLALYAELDDKAESLRRVSESKTRFLANMTHELRTPLNSILSITRILLDRTDGDLAPEQEKQVGFIRKSAGELSALVNDLLDLAKVEANKLVVRPDTFEICDLFGALKGVLRPMLGSSTVSLFFEEPAGIPALHTDEGKLAQVLRNLIANALKFTEHGSVRVSAAYGAGGIVTFSVEDTGIGIATGDQERIFEEFAQVEGPAQRRTTGTGLGLSLSRKLTELLGGRISLLSAPGAGSTFRVTIPARYASGALAPDAVEEIQLLDFARHPVLAVDESADTLADYVTSFEGSAFQILPVRTLEHARKLLKVVSPTAIVMDVLIESGGAWGFLAELKSADATRDIPVIVVTRMENRQKAMTLGADEFALKPVAPAWLLERVSALARCGAPCTVLIVDDDEASRYVLRSFLHDTRFTVIEAADGIEGLRRAREEHPALIFLDLVMPGQSGEEVLAELASGEATRAIPVIIFSSESLDDDDHRRLAARTVTVLNKENPCRDTVLGHIYEALAK
jgi:signal transduction histidine kinase/CheY-like chemotaxis protein